MTTRGIKAGARAASSSNMPQRCRPPGAEAHVADIPIRKWRLTASQSIVP
jgi:hypothetical protein